METFSKAPAESQPLAFEFKEKLPAGYSLISGTLSAIDTADGSDATATVLSSATALIAGTQAKFTVQGGTDLHQYRITLLALLDGGRGAASGRPFNDGG